MFVMLLARELARKEIPGGVLQFIDRSIMKLLQLIFAMDFFNCYSPWTFSIDIRHGAPYRAREEVIDGFLQLIFATELPIELEKRSFMDFFN